VRESNTCKMQHNSTGDNRSVTWTNASFVGQYTMIGEKMPRLRSIWSPLLKSTSWPSPLLMLHPGHHYHHFHHLKTFLKFLILPNIFLLTVVLFWFIFLSNLENTVSKLYSLLGVGRRKPWGYDGVEWFVFVLLSSNLWLRRYKTRGVRFIYDLR